MRSVFATSKTSVCVCAINNNEMNIREEEVR